MHGWEPAPVKRPQLPGLSRYEKAFLIPIDLSDE